MPRATQVSPAQLVSPAHSDDLSAAGTVFPSDSQAVGLALPCLLPALAYDLPQLCSLFLVSHLSEKVTGSRSLTSTLMLASRFTPLSTQGTQDYEPGWGQECVGVSSSQIGLSQQEPGDPGHKPGGRDRRRACQVEGPRRAEGHGVYVLFTHSSLVCGARLRCRGNEGGGGAGFLHPKQTTGMDRAEARGRGAMS